MEWSQIITASIGMIGGGGLIKIFNLYINHREKSEANDPEIVLRNFLKEQIELLTEKQDEMFDKIELLIKENASLKTQLAEANKHIVTLTNEIRTAFRP